MGSRGPVPKRSTQRRRRNKDEEPESAPATAPTVAIPAASEHWHESATRWYESLAESGQAQFFEPSDWAAAQIVAGQLSEFLTASKRSAMMFSHLWSAMTDLLTTEGARRRLKIEIDRDQPSVDDGEAATVARLNDYRSRSAG